MKKEEFLAMSLPFGLKVLRSDKITILEIVGIIGGSIVFHEDSGDSFADKFKCKPIIRPLSDLTKPIEHNGEKFVPIEKIAYSYGYEIRISRNKLLQPIMCEQFNVILQLIEWHFDLFGGIDSGDAINVNSLPENPYK